MIVVISLIVSTLLSVARGYTDESRADEIAIVTMYGSGEVAFVDVGKARIINLTKLEDKASLPVEVAVTPDGATAIVTCESGYISFLDIRQGIVTKTLALRKGPEQIGRTLVPNEFGGVEVTPDGTIAIVAEGNEAGALFFVDMASQTISGEPLMLGDGPSRPAITSDGIMAYVVDDEQLFVLDIPTRTIVNTFQLQGEYLEDSVIVLTSDESRALIIDGNDGWIYLVDVNTGTVIDKVREEGAFTEPGALALSPDGTLAIICNLSDESISFLSVGEEISIDKTINVPGTPCGVAFTTDGTTAIVTLLNTNSIALIDVLNGSIMEIIAANSINPFRAPTGVTIVSIVPNQNSLTISPRFGTYVTTQGFDLTLIVKAQDPNISVIGGNATFDGVDVTGVLASCVIPGTLMSGGLTFRCPSLTGGSLGTGTHTLSVTLDLSDGSSVGDTVTWEVKENTEP